MPETQKWHRIYQESQEEAIRILQECSYLDDNVIVSDFRGKKMASREPVYPLYLAGSVRWKYLGSDRRW